MRVVHVTTVHRWNDGRIFARQCVTLASHGHEVFLLAPSAPVGVQRGVHVRSLGHVSGRIWRMLVLPIRAVRAVRSLRPDVVVVHDPELLMLLVYLRLCIPDMKRMYDAHEDYAAQMRDKEWLPRPFRGFVGRAVRSLENHIARGGSVVLCATPAIRRNFPGDRTHVVLNRPSAKCFPEPALVPAREAGRPRELIFVGVLREIRGARQIIEALELINRRQSVCLKVIGRVVPETLATELAAMPGWKYAELVGWTEMEEVFSEMTEADAGLLTFLPAENHIESQPNKLFEYLFAGLPIVASDFPLWRQLASACDGFLVPVDSTDSQSIAHGIEVALAEQDHSRRASRAEAARARYSWESETSSYLELFSRIED